MSEIDLIQTLIMSSLRFFKVQFTLHKSVSASLGEPKPSTEKKVGFLTRVIKQGRQIPDFNFNHREFMEYRENTFRNLPRPVIGLSVSLSLAFTFTKKILTLSGQ
jgi:hypothetical protein